MDKEDVCVCTFRVFPVLTNMYTHIHTHTHTHILEYYPAIKKKETLPFWTLWVNLLSIMPSEISQTEKDRYYMVSLTCGI